MVSSSKMAAPRGISIIGSTGSIGKQTLDIARAHHPAHNQTQKISGEEAVKVVALAAGKSKLADLKEQIVEFQPDLVSVPDRQSKEELLGLLKAHGKSLPLPEILVGEEGLLACAEHPSADTLVTAVVGFLGVKPTLAAIKQGKRIALANKETMVAAGHLVQELASKHQAAIVPVDSEHSAIFQSLEASLLRGRPQEIEQILLTGSGGPFRTWTKEAIASATVSDALNHPNWSMGAKITIDSATLMNKGLEIIEARWLFQVPESKIKVVIHPQSILHSAVEFVDGSIVGQMGLPDMRLPIHYAIFHPQRVPSTRVPRLSLSRLQMLTFEEPDLERFPCLALCQEVARRDDSSACVLNAANEIVVDSFLKGKIGFSGIAQTLERVVGEHKPIKAPSLEDILECDKWARHQASLTLAAL